MNACRKEQNDTVNLRISELTRIGGRIFPPHCKLQVNLINGKREGHGILLDNQGAILADLYFQHDKLHGLCTFTDFRGEKEEEVNYERGNKSGWFCKYKDSKVFVMGINRNGKKWFELKGFPDDSALCGRIKARVIRDASNLNNQFYRDDLCSLYKSEAIKYLTIFETKSITYEFRNEIMVEYQNGNVIYKGNYVGDIFCGILRIGDGITYSYHNGRVHEIHFLKDGENIKTQTFDSIMREYEKGELVYEGEFNGNLESGFVRNGNGILYSSKNFLCGSFQNGKMMNFIGGGTEQMYNEIDSRRRLVYLGNYHIIRGVVHRNRHCSEESCNTVFDCSNASLFMEPWMPILHSITEFIPCESCGSMVQKLKLTGLTSLHLIDIQSACFMNTTEVVFEGL